MWVAFLGGEICSIYDVSVQLRTGECVNTAHEGSRRRLSGDNATASPATLTTVDNIASTSARELEANKLDLSYCKPHSWVDFALRVGNTNTSVNPETSNIVFDVLVHQASKTNPKALAVYLHLDGFLPEQRDDTEIYSTTATNGVLSVSVPASVIATTTSALFLSVLCGSATVRFKTVAAVLGSDLAAGEYSLGEVFPGNWVSL